MSVPKVKTFCCCVNLHTGSLTIGIIAIVCSMVELFLFCMMITLRSVDVSGNKMAVYVVYSVVSCMQILFTVMMIVGIIKKYPCLTMPWTIWTGILAALFMVVSVGGFTYIALGEKPGPAQVKEITLMAYYLVRSVIWIYFIMVVHSRHKEMMAEQFDRVEGHTFLQKPNIDNNTVEL